VLPIVKSVVRQSREYTGKVDYADMLFLPLVLELAEPLFDLVVVDEAQDMNRAQLDLALMSCTDEGRVCVVGDDKQAIYGFRGADSGAIDRMKEQLQAVEMPLTETYRCPQAVVREANRLVPDLVSNKHEEGSVTVAKTENDLLAVAAKGDFILSRLNAPLAHTCLAFLTRNIPARIVGRDVGETLIQLIDKQSVNEGEARIGDFLVALKQYEVVMVRSLDEADRPEAIDSLLDLTSTLTTLAGEGCMTVGDLKTRIRSLFVDTPPEDMVVLSTVHKAKGLEADRVFILKHTLYNFSTSDEEQNIEYVAITRAKRDLVWVGENYGNAVRGQK
jgi:superfamily I DNA/RNA helicase